MDIQVKVEMDSDEDVDMIQQQLKLGDSTDCQAYLEDWSANEPSGTSVISAPDNHLQQDFKLENITEEDAVKLEDIMEETVAIKKEIQDPTEDFSGPNQNKFPGYCSGLNPMNNGPCRPAGQWTKYIDSELQTTHQGLQGTSNDGNDSSIKSEKLEIDEAGSSKQQNSSYWPNKQTFSGFFVKQKDLFVCPKTEGQNRLPSKAEDDKRMKFERLWKQINQRYLPPTTDDSDDIAEQRKHKKHKVRAKHPDRIESGCIDKHVLACTDDDGYTCYICGSEVNKLANLITHIRTNHVEKIHKCDVCNKAFSQPLHLKAHMEVHVHGKRRKKTKTDKPKNPSQCPDEQSNQQDTSSSKSRNYEHPYVCGVCDGDFAAVINLQTHIASHALKKLYVCPICGDSFVQRTKRHISTHRPPYKCVVCSREYKTLGTLQQHFQRHSNDNWYKCGICGKKFRSSFQLNGHVRKKHEQVKI